MPVDHMIGLEDLTGISNTGANTGANLWLPSHLHNGSQVIEAESGQAAKRKRDKSPSFKWAALNLFALEVYFFSPQKSWTWKTEHL